MLVLTRRCDETIHIGDIVIKVLKIKGAQVMIGIQAPNNVQIVRGELIGSEASPVENKEGVKGEL